MSKRYRWCEASGPVPYPDDSGRMLDNYDELVEGDGWAALAELGFVEEVDEPVKKAKAKAKPKKKATSMPEPTPFPDPPPLPETLPEATPAPEPEPEPASEPEAKAEPEVDSSRAETAKHRTVGEMASEAAANSTDEPTTVTGQAKKVLSKRKYKARKKK